MKALITQALINKLRKDGRREEAWDTRVLNFFAQVRESGVASFYIRYTPAASNIRVSHKLGDASSLPVAQARRMAQEMLARIATGFDPSQEKRDRRDCPTLKEVFEEHYLPHAKLTKKSWKTDEIMFRCHVLPSIGGKTLTAITTKDIETIMIAMRDGGKGGARKGLSKAKTKIPEGVGYAPATCNLVAVLLRYLFNLATEKWAIPGVAGNPATKVELFAVNNIRQIFLSPEQIGRLVEAGQPKPGFNNPSTLQIVMFLVLTGVRKSNVLKAKWEEVDEERAVWNIPITKSGKPQRIQLSNEVLSLIQQLPSQGKSIYLFPSPVTRRPFTSIQSSWDSMRKAAGLPFVRMHDLRHTFASLLVNSGASLYSVQSALGHSNPKMTMRYAHLSDHTQRQAMQNAANQVSSFLSRVHTPSQAFA